VEFKTRKSDVTDIIVGATWMVTDLNEKGHIVTETQIYAKGKKFPTGIKRRNLNDQTRNESRREDFNIFS